MAERALTPVCRAAWTKGVFTPKEEQKTDPKTGTTKTVIKYGCQLVFDQSVSGELQELMNLAFKVGVEAFGDNFWAMVQQGSIRWPFRNGAEINPKTGQPRYEQGTTFMNCSSGSPIDVVSKYCDPADPQKKPIRVTDPTQLWPGQYVRASITFKEYRVPQWGVACYINGLQLWHEGERWGDSFDSQEAFNAEGEAPIGTFGPTNQGAPTGASAPAAGVPSPAPIPPAPPGAPGTPQTGPTVAGAGPTTGPQPGSYPNPAQSTTALGPTPAGQFAPAPGAQPGVIVGPTPGPTGGGGSSLL